MSNRNAGSSRNSPRRIPVIGIIGGIGSGKSAVAKWVTANAHVELIDADILGHEALESTDVKDSLRSRFGEAIFSTDGTITRSELARSVFGTGTEQIAARHDLEKIVHPEIQKKTTERIAAAKTKLVDAILLDAAVLLEAGWRNQCDTVVFIDTPDAVRLARVCENRGWTGDELRRRESSQLPLTEKRREADVILPNDGTVDEAGKRLLEVLKQQGLIKSN